MIKLDISQIKLSKGDVRKCIRLPEKLTPELAEDLGIHIGDGSMYRCGPTGDSYAIRYSGHAINDKIYLTKFIPELKLKLFNLEKTNFHIGRNNEAFLTMWSMGMSNFYNKIFGVPFGNKTKKIDIPKNIKQASLPIRVAFLRGLADTDFCLSFKKKSKYREHFYPVISGCLSSKKLIMSVKEILDELEISSTVMYNLKSRRYDKTSIIHRVDINGNDNFNKWIKLIGFSNEKHLSKLRVLKAFGYCPPNTDILQREKMLQNMVFKSK